VRKLTTTSFAVLALLAFRDWTASELTHQMTRSIGFMWPRAASGIYVEPKSLVDHDLATAEAVPDDWRTRARYSITDNGRDALIEWLRRPSSVSSFESEVALKLVVADLGTTTDALRLIDELAADAVDRNTELLDILGEYAADRGQHRDRAALIGLTARLYHQHYMALTEWATWAKAEVESWPAADRATADRGTEIIAETQQRFSSRTRNAGDVQTTS